MNGYLLVAGLLVTLLSIADATWGERRVFNVLTPKITDAETFLSVYVPWHQLTGVLLLSGIALVHAAFQSRLIFVPVFILALIISNMAVFFALVIGKRQTQIFARTLPQTVLFLVLIVLIILGITSSTL